ncbi:MAG: T9SS type A sorting domain-containing protein, partial [Bacteroidales bacterium]|nr:T9SS type A sorting domain-containing protein [Bacteroidales bacterium]
MKKGNILSLLCMACVPMLFAQNYVTLTFTAKLQDDTWLAIDSIRISNQSRTWTETLYYPDTTLRMVNSVGIEESENCEFTLYQNMPNPCNGAAAFRLQLPVSERVDIKLYDMNGKEITSYSEQLERGMHEFKLTVAAAQLYVLQAKTATQTQSISLVSIESGKGNGIKHASFTPMQQIIRQKGNTDKKFVSNDTMHYVAYCTYNGSVKTKTITLAQTGSNTTHTFVIPMGYAVGDVYYNSGGTAEGIVCWLADT